MSDEREHLQLVDGYEAGEHTGLWVHEDVLKTTDVAVNYDKFTRLFETIGIDAPNHEVWALHGSVEHYEPKHQRQRIGINNYPLGFLPTVIKSAVQYNPTEDILQRRHEMTIDGLSRAGLFSLAATGSYVAGQEIMGGIATFGVVASLLRYGYRSDKEIIAVQAERAKVLERQFADCVSFTPIIQTSSKVQMRSKSDS